MKAQRISRGEIGELAIGYMSALTHDFFGQGTGNMAANCPGNRRRLHRNGFRIAGEGATGGADFRGDTGTERSAGVGVVTSPDPAANSRIRPLPATTYGSQVEPKEHAIKVERKKIKVPSDRESHESASRIKIANGKGADSAPMR